MATNPEFNPNSFDAQLARVLQILEDQNKRMEEKCTEDRMSFATVMSKQDTTNGRVKALEIWKANLRGKITMLAAVISLGVTVVGILAEHFWK